MRAFLLQPLPCLLLLAAPSFLHAFSAPTPPSPPSSPPPPSWLVDAAVGWATMKGLQMVSPGEKDEYMHLPVSLLPASFPKQAFEDVIKAAPVFNELVDRISRDGAYLQSSLGEVVQSDEFTGRLLDMYNQCPQGAKAAQPVALGLHRSDYMIDDSQAGAAELLQVELNTIASSFGCLASVTASLHRYLLERFFVPSLSLDAPGSATELQEFLATYLQGHGLLGGEKEAEAAAAASAALRAMPANPTLERLPGVLAKAHAYYGQPKAVVVFIVQPGERNLFDQRFLELALWERHQIQVVRLTLEDVQRRCALKPGATQQLCLDGQHEVGVVYFRAGYTPVDYPSVRAWDARLLIERSAAVKCPTLGYQLAGTKKIQQLLCEPSALSQFLSPAQCALAQRHFTGMYGLSPQDVGPAGSASAQAVAAAIAAPHAYVLKPQREGGGNNIYDEALAEALQTWSPEKLSGHVLMQRIQAPQREAYLLRQGGVVSGPAISELGIFGTFLGDTATGRIEENQYGGFLVRTKLAYVNEGGVATGFAVVDSPLLVE